MVKMRETIGQKHFICLPVKYNFAAFIGPFIAYIKNIGRSVHQEYFVNGL